MWGHFLIINHAYITTSQTVFVMWILAPLHKKEVLLQWGSNPQSPLRKKEVLLQWGSHKRW
jgi:hypothetical protein